MTKPAHRVGAHKARRKESFYVRVALPDGSSQFFPATDYIGKEMPFDKPRETCAMRVYPDAVCFSVLHLTKRTATDLKNKPIEMPHGPLARLARMAKEVGQLPAGALLVEHGDTKHRVNMVRDDNGVVELEAVDESAEAVFKLGKRGERISVYFTSPSVGRVVALAFIGHLGRPDGPDTVLRCAAKIFNAALALPEFQLLAGMETVVVPSLPGSNWAVAASTNNSVQVELPVQLFTEQLAPVSAGKITVDIDLRHANASVEKLLFHLVPDATLEPHFAAYKDIAERYVASQLPLVLGEELKSIIYDIVLGEVEDTTVERLRETLAKLPGVDLTPTQCRAHQAPEV